MEELIVVSFFKMLPEIFRFEIEFPWNLILLVMFLSGVVFGVVGPLRVIVLLYKSMASLSKLN